MKRCFVIPLISLLFCADICLAQTPAEGGLHPVMASIAARHPDLLVLRAQLQAQQAEQRSGSAIPAPEFSYDYHWGSPSAIGNRTIVELSQSFPFPTVYGRRSRLLDARDQSLAWAFEEERTALLLQAEQLCIETVHCNVREQLLQDAVGEARRLARAYEQALAAGETDKLSVNQVRLYRVRLEKDLEALRMERASLLRQLAWANGGEAVALADTLWPLPPVPPVFDSWLAQVEAVHPALQQARSRVAEEEGELKLRAAENLPTLTAGYVREQVVGERFEGVKVGLSLPLWENKKRVKAARSAVQAARYAQDNALLQWRSACQDLYARAQALDRMAREYSVAAREFGSRELLDKALEVGELSLSEYLLDREAYYEEVDRALETRLQRDQCLSSLWAWLRYGRDLELWGE